MHRDDSPTCDFYKVQAASFHRGLGAETACAQHVGSTHYAHSHADTKKFGFCKM